MGTDLVQPLDWDTSFFGIPIARLHVDGATPDQLLTIERAAHDEGIACGYATVEATETERSVLLQRFGYRLVEVGLTFAHPDGRFTPRPGTSVVRRGRSEDVALLEPVIAGLGPWSRFGADVRFGAHHARRMFRAWVERAAGSDDRMLSIAEDPSGVTGFATHVRGDPDRLDLISVTTPGSGAADALFAHFHEWAGPGPVHAGDTAARNLAIIRFLERCGYRAARSRLQFHRWFDEPSGT